MGIAKKKYFDILNDANYQIFVLGEKLSLIKIKLLSRVFYIYNIYVRLIKVNTNSNRSISYILTICTQSYTIYINAREKLFYFTSSRKYESAHTARNIDYSMG